MFYTTLWSRLTQFSVFLFRIQYDWIRTKTPNSVSWNIRTGICGQEVGILFTCINTSFDSLSTQKLLFLIYRGFCGRVSSVQKLIHLKPACRLGGGGESSVHVGQSRRFTRLLLYRRLQFVSSLQNNFRMTFPILPLSHIYLWLKWSWISRAEVGKDSLFERGRAHVWFLWRREQGDAASLFSCTSFLKADRPFPLPQFTSHMNNVQHIEHVFGSASVYHTLSFVTEISY